jgi:hypothetical protein
MSPAFIRLAATLAFVASTAGVSPDANHLTLDVDLDELRGSELLNFMRAMRFDQK